MRQAACATAVFLFAVLLALGSALPSSTTDEVVPETEDAQWHGMSHFHINFDHIYDVMARHTGECRTKWPCYFRSKVEWSEPALRDYMLAGPIRKEITEIPGLTAFVCPVAGNPKSVSKWIKFDTPQALQQFQALQTAGFNSDSAKENLESDKCSETPSMKDSVGCWLTEWVQGKGKFTVTHNPNEADVQSNGVTYKKHADNPQCVHCTPDIVCFKPSWGLQ